jgi:hypothetical protein
MLSLPSGYLVLDTVQLQVRAWMHQYGAQMACCTVEIQVLEFLDLKWAVTEEYHDYLYGNTFTVLTDNNSLTFVLTSAKLDATGHRWIADVALYNFSIMYRPGSNNADADGLSRLPGLLGKNNVSNISTESVKAICNIQ